MDIEIIISQGLVVKPFEARPASAELRARVQYFQRILNQKRKNRLIKRFKIKSINA